MASVNDIWNRVGGTIEIRAFRGAVICTQFQRIDEITYFFSTLIETDASAVCDYICMHACKARKMPARETKLKGSRIQWFNWIWSNIKFIHLQYNTTMMHGSLFTISLLLPMHFNLNFTREVGQQYRTGK